MSTKQLRKLVRLIHLFVAVCILLFIYSPLHLNATFVALVQFVVVPAILISGVVMWQQPRIVRLFKPDR